MLAGWLADAQAWAAPEARWHAGIILDPVYSGKALYHFSQDVRQDPGAWQGRRVLFLHTGARQLLVSCCCCLVLECLLAE